jgi:hypothetical protein
MAAKIATGSHVGARGAMRKPATVASTSERWFVVVRGDPLRARVAASTPLYAAAVAHRIDDAVPNVAVHSCGFGEAAMARKLLVALWGYLETGVVPEGTTLKG